jgi:hypothetical protein
MVLSFAAWLFRVVGADQELFGNGPVARVEA